MEKFTQLSGIAAPLPMINIDTDKIFPAVYLKTIKRTGLAKWLFQEIRFRPDGSENPDFVLNQEPYRHAEIFYNNCFKNGLLPIALPQAVVDQLMDDARKGANAVLTVDLDKQTISRPDGEVVHFEIDPFRKNCLLHGLDDIGLTEQKATEIAAYEQKARLERPWVFGMTQTGA